MAIKKTIEIEGMHCEKCVAHVKEALEGVEGVRAARVSLEKNNAIVKMDQEVSDEALASAVEAAGFTVPSSGGAFVR